MAAVDWVARASRVLAMASSPSRTFPKRLFRRDAETSTRDARATRKFPHERHLQNLARRCERRRILRIHYQNIRGHGCARCRARHSVDAGERSGLSLELQGGQVRLVFGGSKRDAEAHVHDANERSAAGAADYD